VAWRRGPALAVEDDPIVIHSRETKALLDHLTGRLGDFTDKLEEIAAQEERKVERRKKHGGS
jgi:hypothetical protein